jgi:hypothetical protein
MYDYDSSRAIGYRHNGETLCPDCANEEGGIEEMEPIVPDPDDPTPDWTADTCDRCGNYLV